MSLCKYALWRIWTSGSGTLSSVRTFSAWIKTANSASTSAEGSEVDVERLFTQDDVQKLLKRLTGVDLEGKLFAPRKVSRSQRSHYALMTEETFQKTVEDRRCLGEQFLQFVPVLEPRSSNTLILANDPDIEAFDDCKFVFTDISFGDLPHVHSVTVRETNGQLRSADPEERDRMIRTYRANSFRPVFEPALFRDPYLQECLDRDEHEFVLDWACYYYLPDNPTFIKLCHTIFDRTCDERKFSLLNSTRHFGPFVFYLVLNGKHIPLLHYYASEGLVKDAADLIRLLKIVSVNEPQLSNLEDFDDETIIQMYSSLNPEHASTCEELLRAAKMKEKEPKMHANGSSADLQALNKQKDFVMDKDTFGSEEGPLGEMARDYKVHVIRGSADAMEQAQNLIKKKGQKGLKNMKEKKK